MQSFSHTEAFRTMNAYCLDLKNLEEGLHNWVLDLDDKFFKTLSDGEVNGGSVCVDVELKRCASVFDLRFEIHGEVIISCDRCLEEMEQEVDTEVTLIVKFGETNIEEDSDIMMVSESEGSVDLAWFLYESIVLALPMQRRHADGACNKAMLDCLKAHSSLHTNEEKTSDPRWDALKGLIDNNNKLK